MELSQLVQFREIARTGNMTSAAKALFISQSALSQNLTKLEAELGVSLFDRVNKRLVLNGNGKTALEYTEQILGAIEEMKLHLGNPDTRNRVLKLYAPENPGLRYFGAAIGAAFPNIIIETYLKPENEVIAAIQNETAEIGFLDHLVREKEIVCSFLYQDRLLLSAAPGQEFYDRDSVEIQELNNRAILLPGGTSYLFRRLFRFCKEHRINLNAIIQPDFGLYRSLAANSNHLIFESPMKKKTSDNNRRKQIPLMPEITTDYYSLIPEGRKAQLSPVLEALKRFYA